MGNEMRQQPYSEPLDRSAGLVPGFVLVKAQIGVTGGLPYKSQRPIRRVMQQDDVYRMVGVPLSRSRSLEGSGDPLSFAHPVGAVHLHQNLKGDSQLIRIDLGARNNR